MKEYTAYICDYCGKVHINKEDALKCEKMGHAINTLNLTLQLLPIDDTPFPWIELCNKKTGKTFLVYPKDINIVNDVQQATKSCLDEHIIITSYDGEHEYEISSDSIYEFVNIHAIEKIYKEKNLLPDTSFIDRVLDINVSTVYEA